MGLNAGRPNWLIKWRIRVEVRFYGFFAGPPAFPMADASSCGAPGSLLRVAVEKWSGLA